MKHACFVGIAVFGVLAIALIGASAFPENVLASSGGLYDVGGYKLYLTCSGAGGPTVILDAGLGADHTEWSAVQPAVAKFTRVCSWDRAGLGRSEHRPTRGPATADQIVGELRKLLLQAGIAPPYILVGHSIGGIHMRLFQLRYPADVAGLVMAEGTPEQQELSGIGTESANGETILLGPAAHSLLHWTLPPALPLVVIERSNNTDSVWQAQQAALSARSSNSLLIVALDSDHAVQREQPALVTMGVGAAVNAVRDGTALMCPDAIEKSRGTCLAAGTSLPQSGVTVTIAALVAGGIGFLISGIGLGAFGGYLVSARRRRSA